MLKEGEFILNELCNTDYVVLLFDSNQLAKHIEKKKNTIERKIVFVIGGPYGFSEAVKARVNENMSLIK